MKSWFTVTIQSTKMQNLASNTEVFNLAEVPDIICVKMPDGMPRDMELSGIYDLNANKSLDYEQYVTRDEHKPWIDIRTTLLDLSVGQHVYKLSFTKLGIDLPAICWFSYIIQDNHLDKPYIYMDRSEVK